MAVSVVMPALEMAQESGKVISWRKREGQQVVKGEPLLEVETDKAVVEVESPGERNALRNFGPRGRRHSRGTNHCLAARSGGNSASSHGSHANGAANG